VPICARIADELAEEGISIEVIDLRTLCPYDWDTISASIQKTNRLLCVNEDTEVTNFGEHLIRRAVEELFYELHAPPKLVAGAQLPGIGLADNFEVASVPQKDGIARAMRALVAHEP
jgi:2-oxoisovalerate dehydrogenase E1 component beta subunit